MKSFSEEMRERTEAHVQEHPGLTTQLKSIRAESFEAGAHAALESELVRGMAKRIKAQEQMLVAYRVQKCPSNATFKAMELTAEALKAYDDALKRGEG